MNDTFQISIVARGEGITYREAEREYHFDIFLGKRPYIIYADEYWNGKMPVVQRKLSEQERERIIPRLIAHLKRNEPTAEVVIKWDKNPVPLKTSWDLFLERRRARGITD